jgi:predicted aconitase with swiveling domain
MKSWRTTTSGVIAILLAFGAAAQALIDGNPATNPDWAAVGAAVMAGIGLLTARDHKVTSEQAGAK